MSGNIKKPDLPEHLATQLLHRIAELEQQYARKYNFAHISILVAQTLPPINMMSSCYENSQEIFATMLLSTAQSLNHEPDEVQKINLMEH